MNSDQQVTLKQEIPPEYTGQRLDQALASLFPQYSRAQLQTWIKNGFVELDDQICAKIRQKVTAHQIVCINAQLKASEQWLPQEIALDIIFEDDEIIVINKPIGLVVHPGAGNPDNTLVNALLYHEPALANIPRAGIIHRLDKDTSGLLVVAKTLEAHNALTKSMKNREIKREYVAIIKGTPISGKTIEAPVGRHPTHRIKMAVTPSGRDATTHFRILEKFASHTFIQLQLETGRTHQIRVHMLHIHHPIVGDPVYGRHIATPKNLDANVKEVLKKFNRQALHAMRLSLHHPETGVWMEFKAPLPNDMEELLNALRSNE